MGLSLLGDVLKDWRRYELDDSIYLPIGEELTLEAQVEILPFDPLRKRIFENKRYLLGVEQVRDVVVGLELQLKRASSPEERLKAIAHYAKADAFIDPANL